MTVVSETDFPEDSVFHEQGARLDFLQAVTLVHKVIEHSRLHLSYEVKNESSYQTILIREGDIVVGEVQGCSGYEGAGSSFPSRITAHLRDGRTREDQLFDPSTVSPLKSVATLVARVFEKHMSSISKEPEPKKLTCGFCGKEFDPDDAVRIRSIYAPNPFCSAECSHSWSVEDTERSA